MKFHYFLKHRLKRTNTYKLQSKAYSCFTCEKASNDFKPWSQVLGITFSFISQNFPLLFLNSSFFHVPGICRFRITRNIFWMWPRFKEQIFSAYFPSQLVQTTSFSYNNQLKYFEHYICMGSAMD